jgi:outer membrane cobalamin receptor
VLELPAGFRVFPGLRTDLYSDFGLALSPSLGINLELFDRIVIMRAQYSNDFSAPTMNDLYWSPGGNPGLKPERGIGVEAGTSLVWKYRSLFRIALDATVYRTTFRDGIRWLPVSGSIWSPANMTGLVASGIEINQEFTMWLAGVRMDVSNMWMQTGISSDTPRFDGDPAVGLQLPYVPERSFKTSISVGHRFFTLFASRIYSGERFTTADHSSPLDPLESFAVINAGMTITAGWRNFYAAGSLTIRNLFDEEYEMIVWYPHAAVEQGTQHHHWVPATPGLIVRAAVGTHHKPFIKIKSITNTMKRIVRLSIIILFISLMANNPAEAQKTLRGIFVINEGAFLQGKRIGNPLRCGQRIGNSERVLC